MGIKETQNKVKTGSNSQDRKKSSSALLWGETIWQILLQRYPTDEISYNCIVLDTTLKGMKCQKTYPKSWNLALYCSAQEFIWMSKFAHCLLFCTLFGEIYINPSWVAHVPTWLETQRCFFLYRHVHFCSLVHNRKSKIIQVLIYANHSFSYVLYPGCCFMLLSILNLLL